MTLREWLALQERAASYSIRIDGGPWQDVTVEGFVAAEREAGFFGPDHAKGLPATYAFKGYFTRGLGLAAVRLSVEGRTNLR